MTDGQAIVVHDEDQAFQLMDFADSFQLDPREDALALFDPTLAAQLVAGVRPDTLVYDVSVGGQHIVGLSVQGSQVLASRIGGFETLPNGQGSIIEEITMPVQVRHVVTSDEGEQRVETVEENLPAVRASVAVRYTSPTGKSTTFVGMDEEPRVMALKPYQDRRTNKWTGGATKPDAKATVKAWNKAERNALRKFFAPAEKVLTEFAAQAKQQGQALMVGDEASEYEKPVEHIRTQRREQKLAQQPKLSKEAADRFRQMLRRLQGTEEEKQELQDALNEYLKLQGAALLEQLPASAEPQLYEWAAQFVGLTPESEPELPQEQPTQEAPAEPPVQEPDFDNHAPGTVVGLDQAVQNQLIAQIQAFGRAAHKDVQWLDGAIAERASSETALTELRDALKQEAGRNANGD